MSISYKLKILLCGPNEELIEKFIRSYLKPSFQTDNGPVTGVITKDVELDNGQIATLSVWIIGGQERFPGNRSIFYEGSAGALFVFDLSNAQSLDDVKNLYYEIRQIQGNIPFVLVGDNLDLLQYTGEVIDRDECREYAESQGMMYIETPNKNENIVEYAFLKLTECIISKDGSFSYFESNPTKFSKKELKERKIREEKELKLKIIEENRRKKEEELLSKIKKVLQVSSKVKLSMLRNILDLDEKTFDNRILEWAYILDFRIDGDYIVIQNADIDGFIEILDKQFEQWSKTGKK